MSGSTIAVGINGGQASVASHEFASRIPEQVVAEATRRHPVHVAAFRRHGTGTVAHCLHFSSAPVRVVPCVVAALDEVDIEVDLYQSSVG